MPWRPPCPSIRGVRIDSVKHIPLPFSFPPVPHVKETLSHDWVHMEFAALRIAGAWLVLNTDDRGRTLGRGCADALSSGRNGFTRG